MWKERHSTTWRICVRIATLGTLAWKLENAVKSSLAEVAFEIHNLAQSPLLRFRLPLLIIRLRPYLTSCWKSEPLGSLLHERPK